MRTIELIFFMILSVAMLFSCQKAEEIDLTYGNFDLSLKNVINGNKIVLNNKYTNFQGDTFNITSLRYYISNVKLKKSNGDYYIVPDSYYLIDITKSSDALITISNVPLGEYIELKFSIGVDSSRNHSGAQTGALDPVNQMIWSWNTGYKFISLQGHCWTTHGSKFYLDFDIAEDGNYKTMVFNSLSLSWSDIKIRGGKLSRATVQADFAEMFKTPSTISFDTLYSVQAGPAMKIIADNYADMCTLLQVQNIP